MPAENSVFSAERVNGKISKEGMNPSFLLRNMKTISTIDFIGLMFYNFVAKLF